MYKLQVRHKCKHGRNSTITHQYIHALIEWPDNIQPCHIDNKQDVRSVRLE